MKKLILWPVFTVFIAITVIAESPEFGKDLFLVAFRREFYIKHQTFYRTYLQSIDSNGSLAGPLLPVAEKLNWTYFDSVSLGPIMDNKLIVWLYGPYYQKRYFHAVTIDLRSGRSLRYQKIRNYAPIFVAATNRPVDNFVVAYSFVNGTRIFKIDDFLTVHGPAQRIPRPVPEPVMPSGLRRSGSALYWNSYRSMYVQPLTLSGEPKKPSLVLKGNFQEKDVSVEPTILSVGKRLLAIRDTYAGSGECGGERVFLQWTDSKEQPLGAKIPVYGTSGYDCESLATPRGIAIEPHGRFLLYWVPTYLNQEGVILYQQLSQDGSESGTPHPIATGIWTGFDLLAQ